MGSGQKRVQMVGLGPRTGTYKNLVHGAPRQPCHLSKSRFYLFGRIKPTMHPSYGSFHLSY